MRIKAVAMESTTVLNITITMITYPQLSSWYDKPLTELQFMKFGYESNYIC